MALNMASWVSTRVPCQSKIRTDGGCSPSLNLAMCTPQLQRSQRIASISKRHYSPVHKEASLEPDSVPSSLALLVIATSFSPAPSRHCPEAFAPNAGARLLHRSFYFAIFETTKP